MKVSSIKMGIDPVMESVYMKMALNILDIGVMAWKTGLELLNLSMMDLNKNIKENG